jgi:hypothetical protein
MSTLQRPLTERLHRAMGGDPLGGFGGAVSMPAMPLPAPEMPRNTSSPVFQHAAPAGEPSILPRLLRLQPERPELRDRLAEMVAQLAPLLEEAEQLAQQIEQERQESLEAQHRAIRAQGRKQHSLCGQLRQEFANAELSLQNVAARQENCLKELQGLALMEQRNEHVGRWATDKELSAWRERINKAKERVTLANEAAAIAVRERNEAAERLRPAEEKLARLGTVEIRIRKELAGEAFLDPEFGLSSAPASVAR